MKKTCENVTRNSLNDSEKIAASGMGDNKMIEEPQMNDSGERRTFASGAVRDRGGFKPRPDLVSPHANLREGAWVAKGAEKYGARNYEKGIPISECVASLARHLEAYKLGSQEEDHMAAIRTNAGFILHYEEEIKAGRMDPAIDDMPHYVRGGCGTGGRTTQRESEPESKFIDRFTSGVIPPQQRCLPAPSVEPTDEEIIETLPTPPIDYGDEGRAFDVAQRPAPPQRTVYVAGPMRGYTHFNFPAFDGARDLGESLGWKVISPADLDRAEGLDPFNDPAKINEANLSKEGLRDTAHRDLNALLSLKAEDGDAIAMLPYWKASKGAMMEHTTAVFLGLAILDATTFKPLNAED